MRTTDTVIVGAGPIGLEVAAGLRRAGHPYIQLDAGPIGHTMTWWAPGTRFFSSPERIEIAGVPLATPAQDKATREEYLTYLRTVVAAHGLRVETFRRVVSARRAGDGFELGVVRSPAGVGGPEEERRGARPAGGPVPETIRCRRVVLAIGDMHAPRRLGVPGEDLPHVSHYFEDPHRYVGRRVLIVGGKNSAAEAAIRLQRIGVDVAISYRRAEFDEKRIKYWLLPELKWLIEKGRMTFYPRTAVRAIGEGWADLAEAGPLDDEPEAWDGSSPEHEDPGFRPGGDALVGTPQRVEADDVLLLTGYVQDKSLFEQLGVRLEHRERRPAHNAETMETNVPGVYVCGTAVGGTQTRARVFIETSHVHAERIVRAITGVRGPGPAREPVAYGRMEES